MKAKVIDIGRYIKVPYDVVISKISPRALQVWTLIASDASPEDPLAHVHQLTLAKLLGCSTKTISRALAELAQNHLLAEAGKWQKGKCKIYKLNWNPRAPQQELPEKISSASTQLEIPSECYVHVPGVRKIEDPRFAPLPKAPVPPEPDSTSPLSEAEQEVEWIVAQIRAGHEEQRRKEKLEQQMRAAYGLRDPKPIKSLAPPLDTPITPQNFPIMWGFLSFQWASRRGKRVA